MSKALKSNINAKARIKFKENFQPSDGSFYTLAIEQSEVIMAANGEAEAIRTIFKSTSKPIVEGSFWEEYLEYNYEGKSPDGSLGVEVTGEFAFELDNEDGLDGYDVDDGAIQSIVLGWAEDGDSPKRISSLIEIDGELSDCVEDSDFEGI